jgi:uncharacterized protein (DUF2252 family)
VTAAQTRRLSNRPDALEDPKRRRELGRAQRHHVSRSSLGDWEPRPDRPDAIDVLREQEKDRIAELLPIRHARMSESPLAFFRGAAAVMAQDLATTPATGLRVQACGDAHLLNFGIFASPERELVFDVNDFDETLPAPFEWDVKRLAASITVAGRGRSFSASRCAAAAQAAAQTYRTRMTRFASMDHLDVWYAHMQVRDLVALMRKAEARKLESKVVRKAQQATNLGALEKLTRVVDGQRRITDAPPLIEHIPLRQEPTVVVVRYVRSLADDRRVLLSKYHVVDFARKVVGVGSVGTDDGVVLLLGDSDSDPLFLQVKEAQASVLERFAGPSAYANCGQRVVEGQRLMQEASDIFLGWTRVKERDYYVRQLRDMKGSIQVDKLTAPELVDYARACGAVLARAHARSGDPVAIAAYLGRGDVFDKAMCRFGAAYADQTEGDHQRLLEALKSGELKGE